MIMRGLVKTRKSERERESKEGTRVRGSEE